MFRDIISIRIETSKPMAEVQDLVEERLDSLGRTSVSHAGTIMVSNENFSSFSYNAEISGRLVKRKGYYNLELDFNAKPDLIAWIIGVCFFPVGAAIFVLPHNAKEDIRKKAYIILDDLKYDLEKDDDLV